MAIEISRSMTFGELLTDYPEASRVLAAHGLHCIGCRVAVSESVEDGCRAHGFGDNEIDQIISEIKGSVVPA